MALTEGLFVLALAAILNGLLPTGTIAQTVVEPLAPKQLNDPLPPSAMPPPARPGTVPPRGVPQGMGNETDMTKTPGDDDPSDGVDEPGRDPVPGLPREAPGVNKP